MDELAEMDEFCALVNKKDWMAKKAKTKRICFIILKSFEKGEGCKNNKKKRRWFLQKKLDKIK